MAWYGRMNGNAAATRTQCRSHASGCQSPTHHLDRSKPLRGPMPMCSSRNSRGPSMTASSAGPKMAVSASSTCDAESLPLVPTDSGAVESARRDGAFACPRDLDRRLDRTLVAASAPLCVPRSFPRRPRDGSSPSTSATCFLCAAIRRCRAIAAAASSGVLPSRTLSWCEIGSASAASPRIAGVGATRAACMAASAPPTVALLKSVLDDAGASESNKLRLPPGLPPSRVSSAGSEGAPAARGDRAQPSASSPPASRSSAGDELGPASPWAAKPRLRSIAELSCRRSDR